MIGNQKSANRTKKHSCEKCDYITYNKSDLTKHFLTAKHIQNMNLDTINPPKCLNIFYCEKCDYKCSNKKDFNKHQGTDKCIGNHMKTSMQKNPKKVCDICNKEYLNASGLWKHKKYVKFSILNQKFSKLKKN